MKSRTSLSMDVVRTYVPGGRWISTVMFNFLLFVIEGCDMFASSSMLITVSCSVHVHTGIKCNISSSPCISASSTTVTEFLCSKPFSIWVSMP